MIDKKEKTVTTFYSDKKLVEFMKVYCMYRKISYSSFVENFLVEFYNNNKNEIDEMNEQYNSLMKKLGE